MSLFKKIEILKEKICSLIGTKNIKGFGKYTNLPSINSPHCLKINNSCITHSHYAILKKKMLAFLLLYTEAM